MLYHTKKVVDEFMTLETDERYAFLAFCLRGGGYHTYGKDVCPFFPKAECKFVDFDAFWMKKAVDMGLVETKLVETFIALGVEGTPKSTKHIFVLAPKGQFIYNMYGGEYKMRREIEDAEETKAKDRPVQESSGASG